VSISFLWTVNEIRIFFLFLFRVRLCDDRSVKNLLYVSKIQIHLEHFRFLLDRISRKAMANHGEYLCHTIMEMYKNGIIIVIKHLKSDGFVRDRSQVRTTHPVYTNLVSLSSSSEDSFHFSELRLKFRRKSNTERKLRRNSTYISSEDSSISPESCSETGHRQKSVETICTSDRIKWRPRFQSSKD